MRRGWRAHHDCVKPANGIHEIRMVESALARLDLCEGVGHQTLRQLALHARVLRAPRGQLLLRRGERPAGVFAIVHGAAKARLRPAQGDEVIVELLGPGGTFGQASSLLGHASKLDVVALEESLVLEIDAAALTAQMARDARLARNLASALAAKVEALTGELEHSLLPALQRLAGYLLSIAGPDAGEVHLPVSKTVVAARLGMKKETLSRLFAHLSRLGVIAVGRREIRILERERLAALSSDPARAA